MVDWQMMEGIGGIATAIAVVLAFALGSRQLRQADVHQRNLASAQVIAQNLTPEFLAALERVFALPDAAPPERFREDESLRNAALQVIFTFESAGVFVYERLVPLHAADRVMGGIVRVGWRKLRPFVEAERARLGTPNLAEWWQWLFDRIEASPAPGKSEGAHVAFQDWRAA